LVGSRTVRWDIEHAKCRDKSSDGRSPHHTSRAGGNVLPLTYLDIYAPWCPYCERMQETVYADSEVRSYLDRRFTYARLNRDTTAGTHQFDGRTFSTQQLARAFGARGVPTTVFLEADGTPIVRQPGFIKRDDFFQMIRYIGSGAYKKKSFKAFRQASK